MKNVHLLSTLLLVMSTAFPACTPVAYRARPPVDLLGALSETEVGELMARPVRLSEPLSVAVVWASTGWDDIGEVARGEILQKFSEAIDQPPFRGVGVLPRTLIRPDGDRRDLARMRAAAARFQADVLVTLIADSHRYNTANLLAVTYPALLPLFVVPGNDLAAYVSVQACAMDVRSGVFLGCASAQEHASDRFVTIASASEAMQGLVTTALQTAAAEAARDLCGAVHGRVVTARGTAPRVRPREWRSPPPSGVPYVTKPGPR